ncbi:hypothetical protein BDD12DRAFT_906719 [Trichophaea hybrida]|nr:hypothetical protein BDD12DRAFT_906719 [Trichophaea hybrida]
MEGLGIAANIIAVVHLAAKACTVFYQYAKSAKNCPETVAQLQRELTAVKNSLDGLQKLDRRLDDACKEAGEPPPLISQLSTALKECSATLSELTQELEGSLRNKIREKVRWRLRWPIKESEIADFTSSVSISIFAPVPTMKPLLTKSLSSIGLGVKADVGEVKVSVQDAKTAIQEVHADQSKDILDRRIENRREKLDQLAPLYYNTKHEQAVEKHQEGTGTWLFKKDIYRDWESSSPSSLWIHGIPGSGKTILASTIIERLEKVYPGGSDCGVGFAYFYFQYNNKETKNPAIVIRTLLAQLLHILEHATVTADEILFLSVEKLYERLIVVIDGLDECPIESRRDLLRFVIALVSCDNASILIVSRREVDIEEKLKGFSTISLEYEQKDLKADMRKVINKELEDMEKWGRFQALLDEIRENLILGSGKNMFRWLECQLDLLSRLRTTNAIREALQRLPHTLFETYDRMLECIEDDSSAELVSKAFRWMTDFDWRWHLDELVEALALNENDRRLNRNVTFADPRDLLRICSGLIRVKEAVPRDDSGSNDNQDDSYPAVESSDDNVLEEDSNRRQIEFCHYTVEEYLVSNYLLKHSKLSRYAGAKKITQSAQIQLAKLTLTYLLLDDFSEPCTSESQLDELTKKYRFYNYCATHWIRYCEDENDNLFELVDSFLIDRNKKWIIRRILRKRPELLSKDLGMEGPVLRTAALAGNEDIATDLLELGADIRGRWLPYDIPSHTCRNIVYTEPMANVTWAGSIGGAYNYPHDIPQKYKSDPDSLLLPSKDTLFENPIHTISQYIPNVLPLVLRPGFEEVNIRSWNGSVPLHHAVLGGSLEAVRALVEAGANINAKTYAGRTPLHIAVSLQAGSILEYLLDHKVAIPSKVTVKELEWVGKEPDDDSYKSGDLLKLERDARGRLFQRILTLSPRQGAPTLLPDNWVRTNVFREEHVTIEQQQPSYPQPYVSILIKGKSLKRIGKGSTRAIQTPTVNRNLGLKLL